MSIALSLVLCASAPAARAARRGQGGNKRIRPVPGMAGVVEGIPHPGREWTIPREKRLLAILRWHGVPVVETYPSGRWDRIRYREYAAGSKEGAAFEAHFSKRSLRSLNRIAIALRREGISIGDLQFLIGPGGRIVVADPFNVQWGRRPANQRQIAQLRQRVRRQVGW